jgi:hypothetical protein
MRSRRSGPSSTEIRRARYVDLGSTINHRYGAGVTARRMSPQPLGAIVTPHWHPPTVLGRGALASSRACLKTTSARAVRSDRWTVAADRSCVASGQHRPRSG